MQSDSWDTPVTSALAKRLDSVRAEVETAMDAARARAAARLVRAGVAPGAQGRIESLLTASRKRVDELLGPRDKPEPAPALALGVPDLHALERLLSHVRHSVVRVCFYNLKLFCPSLVDEFDAHVAENIATSLRQLAPATNEIRAFFAMTLGGGRTVAAHFPVAQRRAESALGSLSAAAKPIETRIGDARTRREFAAAVPGHIDAVMAALAGIQAELDARKVAVSDLAREAVQLSGTETCAAGLEIMLETPPCPRVFGDAPRLLNVFLELIHNVVKYSGARTLRVGVSPTPDRLWVQTSFEDNGHGMSSGLLETCVARGVSTGGSGEGLPMVVAVVEGGHLGRFSIDSEEGSGCRATVRLPVKLQIGALQSGT
ncbi:MAG: HAMP domain-containing histidine kinase [Candidatus Hydrogenedentes bacterium]|nr:HAMP domain-containing histidine kinase [Candidatus Hydrogenedentota bacterium]